jgi:N-acetylglucosaminyldiphosphoundecaprenol N-acetyl-beta-D-mannosaminyltransferase
MLMESGRGVRRSFACCGVRIDPLCLAEVVDVFTRDAPAHEGRSVHLCNAYTLSLARRDPGYRDLLNQGDFNLADGAPLAWLARRQGAAITPASRPRGTEVLTALADAGRDFGLRHYFYGSTPKVVAGLVESLEARAPGMLIVGAESPPFRPLDPTEEAETVARIRAAEPHIVWVGVGTPRQDVFVHAFRDRLDAMIVAVGAAFDFVAGTKPSAPGWVQDNGLEWAYRFASEPRRLWRRYTFGNVGFVGGVIADRIQGTVSFDHR